jgi:hypothetical protein
VQHACAASLQLLCAASVQRMCAAPLPAHTSMDAPNASLLLSPLRCRRYRTPGSTAPVWPLAWRLAGIVCSSMAFSLCFRYQGPPLLSLAFLGGGRGGCRWQIDVRRGAAGGRCVRNGGLQGGSFVRLRDRF